MTKRLNLILLGAALVVALATAVAVLMVPTNALYHSGDTINCDYGVSVKNVEFCEAELDDRRTAYIEAGGLVILTLIGAAGVLSLRTWRDESA
jgi:hypothetical protein